MSSRTIEDDLRDEIHKQRAEIRRWKFYYACMVLLAVGGWVQFLAAVSR